MGRELIEHLYGPREQTTTKMAAPSEDDGAIDCDFERQARSPNQSDSGYSARFERRHARLRKPATAALCAQVGG